MRGLWFYGIIFLISIWIAGLLLQEGFSDSLSFVSTRAKGSYAQIKSNLSTREYGGWPSVFLTKPYVVQVESDPHSIPTATYVPTSQPCAYPPCPALDSYQTSYFL